MPSMDWSNLAKIAEESSRPAPAGRYTMVVKSAKWGATKEGHPMLKLTCHVADGPFAGKPMWQNLTFNPEKPNSLRMAFDFMKKVGKDFEVFGKLSDQQQEDYFVGTQFEADVVTREWNGTTNNEIKTVIRGLAGATGGSPEFTPPPSQSQPSGVVSPVNPLENL